MLNMWRLYVQIGWVFFKLKKDQISELCEILHNVLGSLQTAYFIVHGVVTACAVVGRSGLFPCKH